jgi:hypothetical protein
LKLRFQSKDVPLIRPKTFLQVLNAAIAMFDVNEERANELSNQSLKPSKRFKNLNAKETITLCCFLDRGRAIDFKVDPLFKDRLEYSVLGYSIPAGLTLKEFRGNYNKCSKAHKTRLPYRQVLVHDRVYKSWLKEYLFYFNDDAYEAIITVVEGMRVTVLPNVLAGEDEISYEFQGKQVRLPGLLPVPVMHKSVTTLSDFGVRDQEGHMHLYYQYQTAAGYDPTKHPIKHQTLGPLLERKVIEPRGFDRIPLARIRTSAKEDVTNFQIKGLRVEIKTVHHEKDGKRFSKELTRWTGLQNDKLVSLPLKWVERNFSESFRKKVLGAQENITAGDTRGWVRLPIGDCRLDDPPCSIRNSKAGLNMYYQGQVDNCLPGGFVNALYHAGWKKEAQEILAIYKETTDTVSKRFISKFIRKVQAVFQNKYKLVALRNVRLLSDDTLMPLLVVLRARDGSESHSITVFQDFLFDSASRFVLRKCLDSLDWSCGASGYDCPVKVYGLQETKVDMKKPPVASNK